MKDFPRTMSKTRGFSLGLLILTAGLSSTGSVEAGLSYQSSNASVTYSVYNTGSQSGVGTFNNSGMLTYSGGGLPSLTTQVANSSQSFSTSSNSSLTPLSFVTTPTTTPSDFGSATTDIYSGYSGSQGGKVTQGGVYWSLATTLSDNLASGAAMASVSFSTASATYTNFGLNAVTITPGSLLSIAGTLGSSDSFIAAGLTTSITIGYGEDSTTTALDPIILASGFGVNIASKGSNTSDYASVTVSGNSVTGSASNLASSMTIYSGESITVTSSLTLISDPGSTIGITDALPPGLTNIPDFGSFSSSPLLAVPEPSTVVLMGSGLVFLGFWGRSKRQRQAPKS
jgi:hypothetical protein